MQFNPEKLVKIIGKIKAERSELSASFKAKDKELKDQEDTIKKSPKVVMDFPSGFFR